MNSMLSFESRARKASLLALLFLPLSALAQECMRPPLPPEAMNVFIDRLKSDPQSEAELRDVLTGMIIAQSAARPEQAGPLKTVLQSVVTASLASSKNGAEFNQKLGAQLTPLCGLMGKAAATTEAPKPIALNDQVETALQAKLATAQNAYAGTDGNKKLPPLEKLVMYHDIMFDIPNCDRAKYANHRYCKKDGTTNLTLEGEISPALCIGAADKTAACSRKVFNEIKRRNEVIDKQLTDATAIKADATEVAQIAALKRFSDEWYNDTIAKESIRGPFYGLYAGPSFVLQDGGEWNDGLEVYVNFNTEAFDRDHCPFARICRGFFDASFVTPDAYPKEVDDQENLPIAVFESKGRLRVRAGYQWHWSDWIGVEGGVGLTSPISDQSTSVRAEPRAHFGVHLQTAYPDRAIGEVFVGYARDKSWERLVDADGDLATTADQSVQKRFDRILIEGTVLFPRVDLGGFTIAARLSADAPISGNTQSEVRASVLLYYPLNSWLEKFRPTTKAATPPAE